MKGSKFYSFKTGIKIIKPTLKLAPEHAHRHAKQESGLVATQTYRWKVSLAK
jgi:hypothetical protein